MPCTGGLTPSQVAFKLNDTVALTTVTTIERSCLPGFALQCDGLNPLGHSTLTDSPLSNCHIGRTRTLVDQSKTNQACGSTVPGAAYLEDALGDLGMRERCLQLVQPAQHHQPSVLWADGIVGKTDSTGLDSTAKCVAGGTLGDGCGHLLSVLLTVFSDSLAGSEHVKRKLFCQTTPGIVCSTAPQIMGRCRDESS